MIEVGWGKIDSQINIHVMRKTDRDIQRERLR